MFRRRRITDRCGGREAIKLKSLKPGDILHVKLGIVDMGDGQGPWIPTQEDIEATTKEWEQIAPEGVKVIVTHMGTETDCISVDNLERLKSVSAYLVTKYGTDNPLVSYG